MMLDRYKTLITKRANSIKSVFIAYFATILIAAGLFTWIEPVGFLDGAYWAFISSSTIGYGDITPETAVGKLLAMLCAFLWAFVIVPLVVGNLVVWALRDKNEWTHGEQEWAMNRLQDVSAYVMMNAAMQQKALEVNVEIARALGVSPDKLHLPSSEVDYYRPFVEQQPADTADGNLSPEDAKTCGG